jgi:hypothetical protein
MCFFSAPSVSMPSTVESPAIKETKAPEPEAVVFGGSDKTVTQANEGTRSKGVGSLTIKKVQTQAVSSGANTGLNASTN